MYCKYLDIWGVSYDYYYGDNYNYIGVIYNNS